MRILVIPLLLVSSIAPADEWFCSMSKKFDDGWSKNVDIKLSIKDDRIDNIYIESCLANGQEAGGSCCFFDSKDFNKNNIKYSIEDNYHIFKSPDSTSEVTYAISGEAITLNTSIASEFCGFSAEVPSSITFSKTNHVCNVK